MKTATQIVREATMRKSRTKDKTDINVFDSVIQFSEWLDMEDYARKELITSLNRRIKGCNSWLRQYGNETSDMYLAFNQAAKQRLATCESLLKWANS